MNDDVFDQVAEYTIISAAMRDMDAMDYISQSAKLHEDHLYLQETRVYFKAIKAIYQKEGICSPLLVKSMLELSFDKLSGKSLFEIFGGTKTFGEFGMYYQRTNLPALQQSCDIIFDKYNFRQVKAVGSELMNSNSFDPNLVLRKLADLAANFKVKDDNRVLALSDIANDFMPQLREKELHPERYAAYSTGFVELDNLSVIQPGTTTIVAARTSAGKSAFVLQALGSIVESGKNALLFSAEIDRHEIMNRIISRLSKVNVDKLRDPFKSKGFTDEELELLKQAHARVMQYHQGMFIYDWVTSADQVIQIADSVRIHRPIHCIALDYLQNLMFSGNDNMRRFEISEAAKKLFDYGKRTKTAIIIVSQLRRSREALPTIYDLKESGDLENCSDKVVLLYREEINSLKTEICKYSVAKNRLGQTTSDWTEMSFRGEFQFFEQHAQPANAVMPTIPKIAVPIYGKKEEELDAKDALESTEDTEPSPPDDEYEEEY